MKKIILIIFLMILSLNVFADDGIRYSSLINTESIKIYKETNEVKLINKSGQETSIDITNFSGYQDELISEDDYPLYIIKNNGEYSFSKTKTSGTNIFMLSSKMMVIDFSDGATSLSNCETMLGIKFINLLKNNIFKVIYILIPIILIVLSSYDFAVLVFSDTKEGIPGAIKKFSKRVIAAVLIFFIPTILIFLTGILGTDEIRSCIQTFKTVENIEENN